MRLTQPSPETFWFAVVYAASGRKQRRGGIHTKKSKRKGRRGLEKEEETGMISLLHPTNPPVNSDVFKIKKIRYGIKQNRNKTLALFPNFPLPLNYLDDFFSHVYPQYFSCDSPSAFPVYNSSVSLYFVPSMIVPLLALTLFSSHLP